MSRRFPTALAAILTVAAFAAIAFAWAGEHPKDLRLTGGDGWPDGLADLVNYDGRVHGFFINASNYFFYAGEAKALNAFLEKYATLKGVPLTLVLHPGRGRTHGIGVADPGIPYDWSLSIDTPLRGKETPDGAGSGPPTVIPVVNVMLGGNIGLDDLDVPLGVSVESGGEIEEFVAHHQAKQSLAKKAG